MKIIPSERIKVGGKYKPADHPCDVPEDVGKGLIDDGKAKSAAGRPTGGKAGGGKADEQAGAEGGKAGGE